jgi:hypothetical protein
VYFQIVVEIYPDLTDIGYEVELEAAETVTPENDSGVSERRKNQTAVVARRWICYRIFYRRSRSYIQQSLEQLIVNGKAKGTCPITTQLRQSFRNFARQKLFTL